MQLSIVTTVVAIMAVVVVSECCSSDRIGSVGSSTSGSSRFRGNVFRATQDGYITSVLTGVSSGTLRIVIQKASSGSTPSSATWNGVYDRTTSVSGSLNDNRAHGMNVRVEVGDMFLVGFYMESSTTYRYQSYSSSLVSGLGCITWLSGASDGSNAGVSAYFLPSSPSFPNTVYQASVIISSTPTASSTSSGVSTSSSASCLAGTNGVICSGYPCSSSCQCPTSVLASFMDSTDCSPVSSLPSSSGGFCSGTGGLNVGTGSTGVVESNPISSNYESSSSCLWEISPPFSTSRVILSILRFETESSYDSVEIRSGSGGNLDVFGTYTGTLSQGSYFEIELCGDVAIEFTSDGSVEYSGFYIGYAVGSPDPTCTPSGARDLQTAQASTTSDVSSSSSSSTTTSASSLGSSSSSSNNSMILIYVLPGVFLVITLVLVSVYRAYRRKGAIATRSVDYDPNDDEHADRHRKKLSGRRLKRAKGKGGKKGKKGAAKAKAAQEKRSKQGRLSEWKRRNAVELGIDEDDMDDGDDDSGATTADVDVESSAYAYEYVEHTSSDEYDEDDEDSDDAAPPSYGKATSSTVRNRFLDLGV